MKRSMGRDMEGERKNKDSETWIVSETPSFQGSTNDDNNGRGGRR